MASCWDWLQTGMIASTLRGGARVSFSTLLFYKALAEFIELASRLGRNDDVDSYNNVHGSHQGKPRSIRLDGKWFLRGYLDSGGSSAA